MEVLRPSSWNLQGWVLWLDAGRASPLLRLAFDAYGRRCGIEGDACMKAREIGNERAWPGSLTRFGRVT
jgi:hypothetical protein